MGLRLETDRLLIREYTMDDLADVHAIVSDPEVFWWVPPPLTLEWSRAWLTEEIDWVRREGTGRHAVVLKATGRVVGGSALVGRHLEWGFETELGYHLRRDHWGRGYATEAARAMLEHARASGLRRLVSLIYIRNPRSEGVARRLGMRPERDLVWAGLPHRCWAIDLPAPAAGRSGR